MAKVTRSFTLDDQADRNILNWLDRVPSRKKSEAIRVALRDHLHGREVTLGDIYRAVQELDRRMASGAALAEASETRELADTDEPTDVAAALDSLGL